MTLRQVLDIIWRRRLLVVIMTLLVLAGAGAYVQFSPTLYESSAVLRFSTAATQVFNGGSGYDDIDLDLDPELLLAPDIMQGAADTLGEDLPVLQEATSVRLLEGVRTNRLRVTSQGDTPEQAQERANTIASNYVAHLQRQVDEAIAELELDLAVAERERAEAIQQASSNPSDQFAQSRLQTALSDHLDLQRDIDALRQSGPPASMMQEALPGTRVGTDALTLLGVALISGLVAGAGAALIREQFDDRLRDPTAIEEAVGQPVLAEVALLPHRKARDTSLPVASAANTPFNENIRTLRTSLQVLHPDPPFSVVITSPEPGNGKTFLSANLAVALARGGRSVILVGGDLRRPRLEAYFGGGERRGFAEALRTDAGTDELRELLVPTQFDGLKILPAGLHRHLPADLLAGDTLPRVMARLATMADAVLIDSPPGLALTDAAILAAQANSVVVITSVNSTKIRDLQDTLRTLTASGATVAGVVANRAQAGSARTYAAYYYDEGGAANQVGEAPDPTKPSTSSDRVSLPSSGAEQASPRAS